MRAHQAHAALDLLAAHPGQRVEQQRLQLRRVRGSGTARSSAER